jgi:hypothetical protein
LAQALRLVPEPEPVRLLQQWERALAQPLVHRPWPARDRLTWQGRRLWRVQGRPTWQEHPLWPGPVQALERRQREPGHLLWLVRGRERALAQRLEPVPGQALQAGPQLVQVEPQTPVGRRSGVRPRGALRRQARLRVSGQRRPAVARLPLEQ